MDDMQIEKLFTIELKHGETVVAATAQQDSVLVFTDYGTVYRIRASAYLDRNIPKGDPIKWKA